MNEEILNLIDDISLKVIMLNRQLYTQNYRAAYGTLRSLSITISTLMEELLTEFISAMEDYDDQP